MLGGQGRRRTRRVAPGDERPVAVLAIGLPVQQGRSLLVEHRAASRAKDGIAGSSIPLHRLAEARVDVGIAFREDAELQRRSRATPLGDRQTRQEGLRLRIGMRPAGKRDETVLGIVANVDRATFRTRRNGAPGSTKKA